MDDSDPSVSGLVLLMYLTTLIARTTCFVYTTASALLRSILFYAVQQVLVIQKGQLSWLTHQHA